MIIQIIYSLRDEDKDYTELYDYIKSIGEYHMHLDCSWWVYTNDNICISNITKELISLLGTNNYLQVIDITNSNIKGFLSTSSWQWLKERQQK